MANHRKNSVWDKFVEEITSQEKSASSAEKASDQIFPQPPEIDWDFPVSESDSLSIFLEKLQASAPFSDDETIEQKAASRTQTKESCSESSNTIFPKENNASNYPQCSANDSECDEKTTSAWTAPASGEASKEEHPTNPKLDAVTSKPKSEFQRILSEIDEEQKRTGKHKRQTNITGDEFAFHPPHLSTTPSHADMPQIGSQPMSEVSIELARITLTGQPIPKQETQQSQASEDNCALKTSNQEAEGAKRQPPAISMQTQLISAEKAKDKQPPLPPPLPSAQRRQSILQAQTIQAKERSPLADDVQLFLPSVSFEPSGNNAAMALQQPSNAPQNAPSASTQNPLDNIQATTENPIISHEAVKADSESGYPQNKMISDDIFDGKRISLTNTASSINGSANDTTISVPAKKSFISSKKKHSLPKIRTNDDSGDWVPLLPRLGKRKNTEPLPQPHEEKCSKKGRINNIAKTLDELINTPESDDMESTSSEQETTVSDADAAAQVEHFFKSENAEEPSLEELISEAVDPITQMTEPNTEMMEKLSKIVETEEDEDSTAVMDRDAENISTAAPTPASSSESSPKSSTISIETRFPLRPKTLTVSMLKSHSGEFSPEEIIKHLPFSIPKGYSNFTPIGHGTQASVFYATDPKGQSVALKCFDMYSFSSWKDEELLRREVNTLRELNCKGIPRYIDFIEDGQYAFLVESYIDAPSLEHRINNGFRPTMEQVIAIMNNAAWILKTLETRSNPIIHRDIKPANILVDDDMNVSIVDFGVVAAIRQHTIGLTFAGTAGYLAPEQLYGKVTPAADIFGLGMSILHLVTHVPPCEMDMIGLKPNIDKYIPLNIPEHFCLLLHDMIEPDPNHRIADANELLDRIASLEFNAIKLRKKGKNYNNRSGRKRLASIERAKIKRAKKMEKLALRIAGPKAKPNRLINLPEKLILHDNIHRRTDVYRSSRFICILQLSTLLFIVIGLFFTDSVMVSVFDSWKPLFFSDLPVISTFSMIVSCIGLCIYNHYTNKGIFPLKENSKYVQMTRNDNKLLNDMYRYAITSEQSETFNYCHSGILTELLWDKFSDEFKNLKNSEDELRELTKQVIMSSIPESNTNKKPISDLKLPNSDLKKTLKILISEDEETQFTDEDFCIACPPPKSLSIPKLLLHTLPFIILTSLFVFILVPMEISSMDMDSALPIIGYVFINLLAMFLPYIILIIYITSRGQTSPKYQENFLRFKKRFLLSCQQDKLKLEENNGETLDSPVIKREFLQ